MCLHKVYIFHHIFSFHRGTCSGCLTCLCFFFSYWCEWMNKHWAAGAWGKDRINRPQIALLSWAIVLNKPFYSFSPSSSTPLALFLLAQWKLNCLIPWSHITTVNNNIKQSCTMRCQSLSLCLEFSGVSASGLNRCHPLLSGRHNFFYRDIFL